jgi:hypothetical protein
MGIGVYNNTGLGVSETLCPDASLGQSAKLICSVPAAYDKAQGQMDFLKRGSGGEIYIGICGKKPTSGNYDIVLTDTNPFYNIDGLAVGDISVLASTSAQKISINILTCNA